VLLLGLLGWMIPLLLCLGVGGFAGRACLIRGVMEWLPDGVGREEYEFCFEASQVYPRSCYMFHALNERRKCVPNPIVSLPVPFAAYSA
jgi:hypothetical protein